MSDLDKCKKYLRSILLASKGGVPGAQVVAKYKDIVGESVPYRRFNYNSLETFLQSIPDVCRIELRGRDVMVVGVETPETKHIKDLIQRQGGKGGGKGGGGRPAPVNVNKFYNNKPQFSQSMNTQNSFRGPGTIGRTPLASLAPSTMNKQVPSSYQTKQPPPRKPQPSVTPVKVTPKKVTTPLKFKPDPVSQNFPVTKESVKIWTGRVRKCLQDRPKGWLKTQVERSHERQYQERLPDTGTKEHRKFLQDMTVPRKCISELIPEEFENLSESEMEKIILRIQTLSNSALESKKDTDCLKKKSTSSSTCGELLGQPRDSSAPEVNLDLGDSHEEKLELESSPRRSASRTDQVDGMEEQTLHQHQHQDQDQCRQLQRQQQRSQQEDLNSFHTGRCLSLVVASITQQTSRPRW